MDHNVILGTVCEKSTQIDTVTTQDFHIAFQKKFCIHQC